MLDRLKSFQSKEKSNTWDILQAWVIIKEVLIKIRDVLENHWEYSEKIESMSKDILTRAMILDTIFNHLFEISWPDLDWNTNILSESSDLYYHTPAIWVFYNWNPIFLNRNYFEALWAEDLGTLKKDIIEGKALTKYYIPESQDVAKTAVLKLKHWERYKDLKLTTTSWKTISWNSFWKTDWLEIRIWNDVTYWTFKRTEIWSNNVEENTSLKTKQLINSYIIEVSKIMDLNIIDKTKLVIFSMLCEILDKIWDDWQYLMNITVEKDEVATERMFWNNNYLNAMWLTYDQIREKIKNNTLYRDHYRKDTESLIKWLWETLKEEWYYISDFTLLDSNKTPKNYSWYRKLIEDNDLWIHRTFWIWNNAISKDNAEIMRFLWE